MKHSLHTLLLAVVAAALAACSGDKFHVEGVITDAADSTLYFEHISLEGLVTLDSARLTKDGAFSFAAERPEAPDFYSLRIAGQAISLSIDSTETVRITASYPTMATDYKVEGSMECEKIKKLSRMQMDLQTKVMAIENDRSIDAEEAARRIERLLSAHKERVKADYIFKAPYAASAYYALFQTIGRYLIFNPRTSSEDITAFRAVATNWDTFHPGSLRAENLHNITLEGVKTTSLAAAASQPVEIDGSKIETAGLIDIQLTDNKGRLRSLTELKGKVVMLDFHLFASKESTARILMLRELYTKYHDQGFEIYQVSIDPDEHFWKQQTAALPWISVHDGDGLNSSKLTLYNVQQLPEYFLIDRGNNLICRSAQTENLEAKIAELLGAPQE